MVLFKAMQALDELHELADERRLDLCERFEQAVLQEAAQLRGVRRVL